MKPDKKQLMQIFTPSFTTNAERFGPGYRIQARISWPFNPYGVRAVRVRLTGINPLTGVDLEESKIETELTFDKASHVFPPMRYHGKFQFKIWAILSDGEVVPMDPQPISLNCPANVPYIKFSQSSGADRKGYKAVKLESNCWNFAKGKVWLAYNGQMQCLSIPEGTSGAQIWYVPTSDPVRLSVRDDVIKVV